MIAKNGHIRLVDFGLSKRFENTDRTYTVVGSPDYIAPEILTKKGYGLKVDFWSLGVLIYELFSGRTPFKGDTSYETYSNIAAIDYSFNNSVEPITRDLIRGLLNPNPSARFSYA
jgi:serine/threonine protein kinase